MDSIKNEPLNTVNNDLLSLKIEKISKSFSKYKENIIDKLSEIFKGNGTGNTNAYIEKINDIINAYREFLTTLTTAEVGALAHILICIVILLSLFSIISIFIGDSITRYFKLEEKFPRLARFIEIRRKFKTFYFIIHVLLIILGILAILYINILTFI